MLLIAGNGIREGVGAIAQFLDRNGSLHFTFGLIECAIYDAPGGGHYVHAKVLAQTINIPQTVLLVGTNQLTELDVNPNEADAGEANPELLENRARYREFWREFLKMVRTEATQLKSKPATSTNQIFWMPKGSEGWVAAYLGQSGGDVGVYLSFHRGQKGDQMYAELCKSRDEMNAALGVDVDWRTKNGQSFVIITKDFSGNFLADSRDAVQKWLADHTERFFSVFRPRIDRILPELG